jgi:isoaspartyl peptidase/L-asparaginase-like protein (Ntn-hydrolase superfamily)
MEETPHVMLVGEGAQWFALQQGLKSVDLTQVQTKKDAWVRKKLPDGAGQGGAAADPAEPAAVTEDNHDTITLLVLGADGTLSGGCSTSGLADKLPGRVGDSPILGSGLYVDNEVGAAGATGVGENIMRYCAAFLIVELMRQGLHPAEACRQALDRIARTDPLGRKLDIHFIAVDKHGRYGAATTGEFPYAVTYPGYSEVLLKRA